MRSRRVALATWLCLVATPLAAGAKVFYSTSEALELAFPDAERVEDRTFVLDDAQARAVEELAKEPLESRLVTLHTGYRDDRPVGYALIDVHTVRTLPEAFLVVLSPAGEVRSIRVLAFYEPGEYLPAQGWLERFQSKALSDELRLGGEIHGIAGSTLTARAVTGGVRRVLALFEVLVRRGSGNGSRENPARGSDALRHHR